jgi:predicted amidophosphoribosyltransferase
MLDNILSFIAPHYCCGCDKVGSLLCANCKNNINDELKMVCIACHRPTADMWLCKSCHMPYERAWVVGERDGVLQRLVGLYKFQRAKEGYKVLGDLLLGVLPELPEGTIVVPVPTVSGHVRERGYDHMLLIAKYIARKRRLKLERLLYRRTTTKQRQATARQRTVQARQAFMVNGSVNSDVPYLIVDDVITTGATIKYASQALCDAGAEHVWIAAIARQTLD